MAVAVAVGQPILYLATFIAKINLGKEFNSHYQYLYNKSTAKAATAAAYVSTRYASYRYKYSIATATATATDAYGELTRSR